MRASPAYKALLELPRTSDLKRNHRVKRNQSAEGLNYFHIAMTQGNAETFVLGGTRYEADPDSTRVPHLSVYEKFRLNERHGLSVFHFTWYGVSSASSVALGSDDNSASEVADAFSRVVVHVYFSQTGAYLSSQVKGVSETAAAASASPAIEIPLTSKETVMLQRYVVQCAMPIISGILQFVQQQADAAREQVNATLSALEKIDGQQSQYFRAASICVRHLENFDQWRFERTDSRLSWLRAVVSGSSGSQQVTAAAAASPTLFVAHIGSDDNTVAAAIPVTQANSKPVNRKRQTKRKAAERRKALNEALSQVDERLDELEANTAIDDVESALQKLPLLEQCVEVFASHGFAGSQEKVHSAFRNLRTHQQAIQSLFEEKAMLGDLAAVEKLSPFVPGITALFLKELVITGDKTMIEYIIDYFPESMVFVNHSAFSFGLEGEISDLYEPILMFLLDQPESLDLFEMLLQKGANPNVHSTYQMTGITLLDKVVRRNLMEHLRVLLQYGVRFYWDISGGIAQRSQGDLDGAGAAQVVEGLRHQQSRSKRRYAGRRGRRRERSSGPAHKQDVARIKQLDSCDPPFFKAIMSDQLENVKLFIEFGVLSSPYRNERNFDAVGEACCREDKDLNPEIVRTLAAGGADLNALQGVGGTPLQFQLQYDRFLSAVLLLSLGADPNIVLPIGVPVDDVWLPHTVFLQAVARGNVNFTRLFLTNTRVPLSVTTYVRACGFYFSPTRYNLSLTLPSLKVDVNKCSSTEMGHLLFQYHAQFVEDADQLRDAVTEALGEAKQYFSQGKFTIAEGFYMVGLLFGEPEVRHQACFDIGRCFEGRGQNDTAAHFYILASQGNGSENVARQSLDAFERCQDDVVEILPSVRLSP